MSFLAPLFLAGIALVAGPILFHLMRQAPRKRVVFSSTEHLDATPPKVKQSSRIQNPLLLLLRCLILILLCSAFARPFFYSEDESDPAMDVQRDIVLAIDQSASMGRGTVWQQASQRASEIAASLGKYDSLSIVLFSDTARTILDNSTWNEWPEDNRSTLLTGLLEQHTPLNRAGNIDTGVQSAIEELEILRNLRESHGFGEVILISDFATGSRLSGLAGLEWPAESSLRREQIIDTSSESNVGLQWMGWSEDEDGQPLARIALIHSPQDSPIEVTLSFTYADTKQQIAEPTTATVGDKSSTLLSIEVPRAVKQSALEVTLSGDSDPFDNKLFVAPDFVPELTISYRGENGLADTKKIGYFLNKAFSGFSSPMVQFSEWTNGSSLESVTAIIVDSTVDQSEAEQLRVALQSGSTALLILSEEQQLPLLRNLTNSEEWTLTKTENSYALFGKIDFKHPSFNLFSDPRYSNFANIRFWNPQILTRPENLDAITLAEFDNQSPAILEIPIGDGRLIVWNHSWNPRESQWALSSKFVPWLHRFATRAAGASPAPSNSIIASDTLDQFESFSDWKILGSQTNLPEKPKNAGIYQANSDGSQRLVAFQLAPSESQTTPISLDTWEGLGLPDFDSKQQSNRIAQYAESIRAENAQQTEQRQKLWQWMLIAAIVLLALESLLAIQIGKRQEIIVS